MNLYDIIILIVALLGLIDGLRRGLIQTIGAIAGVVCGIFAAKALSYLVAPYISQLFESASLKSGAGCFVYSTFCADGHLVSFL